jgi:hypothetical protein
MAKVELYSKRTDRPAGARPLRIVGLFFAIALICVGSDQYRRRTDSRVQIDFAGYPDSYSLMESLMLRIVKP